MASLTSEGGTVTTSGGGGGGSGGNGNIGGGNIRTTRIVLFILIMACSLVYVQFIVQHHDTLIELRTGTMQDMDSFKGPLVVSQERLPKESQKNDASGVGVESKPDAIVAGNDEIEKPGEEVTISSTAQTEQERQDDSMQQQQRSMLRKPVDGSRNSEPLVSQPMAAGSSTGRKPMMIQDKITTSPLSKTLFIILLMAISGICEAICNRRFGCHPNMMTGNTVKCMDALSLKKFDVVIKLSVMIANYVAGAFLYGILKHSVSSTFHVPILVCVARTSLFCFCMSDMVVRGVIKTAGSVLQDILRLGIMALGFGMINAAANVQVGMVTNAVTKHWTDFGLGSTEMVLVGEASNGAWSNSGLGVVSFLTALLVTNIVQGRIEEIPDLKSKLPPLGTSLGVMYYLLFTWFASRQIPV